MTSEDNDEASGQISAEIEERRVNRDRRLKKKISKNREMKKKNFSVKCAKCKYFLTRPIEFELVLPLANTLTLSIKTIKTFILKIGLILFLVSRSHTAPSGRSLTNSMTSTLFATPSNASSRRLAAAQRMNAQLKESNAALARTLNAALIDNRRLTEELSETRMELADRRQNRYLPAPLKIYHGFIIKLAVPGINWY